MSLSRHRTSLLRDSLYLMLSFGGWWPAKRVPKSQLESWLRSCVAMVHATAGGSIAESSEVPAGPGSTTQVSPRVSSRQPVIAWTSTLKLAPRTESLGCCWLARCQHSCCSNTDG